MKIAVSSTGTDLDAQVDQRFGRCAFFVVVDTNDMSFEAIPNDASGLSGGAGIQAATTVSAAGVSAVLTGNCGPKAMQALSAAGIKVYPGVMGSVRNAVEQYKKGALREASEPTVDGKSGLGAS